VRLFRRRLVSLAKPGYQLRF